MATEKTTHYATAFCEMLNGLRSGWTTEKDVIHGPDRAAVHFFERPNPAFSGTIEVEFTFRDDDPQSFRHRDAVDGFGATDSECARYAARLWSAANADALLELKYSGTGAFAQHLRGDDPQGFSGWHCIRGTLATDGHGLNSARLKGWWQSQHTVLPAISPFLRSLSADGPHSIQILLGGQDVAEVRLDGELNEGATDALLALDWPRIEPPGFLRLLVLGLHRD